MVANVSQNRSLVIKEIAKALDRTLENLQRETTKPLFNKLVNGTPRDTGQARNSWKMSNRLEEVLIPAEPGHYGSDPNNTHFSVDFSAAGGGKIYIGNFAHYILLLEFGKSRQAPHGWVRKTLAGFPLTVIEIEQEVALQAVAMGLRATAGAGA